MEKIKLLVMADGTSIHTEKWISGLSLRDEFDIYLLTMNPEGTRKGILGNPKVRGVFEVFPDNEVSRKGGNYHYLWNLFKIKKIVKNLEPDIINTIYLTSYGFVGALVKGKSLLCHFMIGSDIMVTPYRNIIYKWITKYTLSRGDFFVSSSGTMSKKLLELFDISEKKLLTQQYGVGDEVINYPQQIKEYDFISNRAWVENSNIPVIIEIFSKMNSPSNLVLIGDNGPLEKEIKEKISVMPNIKHLGALPYMENIDAVARSKFYISLASSDGTSLSVLEAMALGAIPILSNIEPNREWVEDGINGFLININDISGAIKKFNVIACTPVDVLIIMKQKNIEIIKQRGSLRKNMNHFADSLLSLSKEIG